MHGECPCSTWADVGEDTSSGFRSSGMTLAKGEPLPQSYSSGLVLHMTASRKRWPARLPDLQLCVRRNLRLSTRRISTRWWQGGVQAQYCAEVKQRIVQFTGKSLRQPKRNWLNSGTHRINQSPSATPPDQREFVRVADQSSSTGNRGLRIPGVITGIVCLSRRSP